MLKPIRLKNGSEEPNLLVNFISNRLAKLLNENPIPFYELVSLCRNPSHELYEVSGEVLKSQRFVEPDGTVTESIRNIVLSGAVGERLDMMWTSPVAPAD